MTGSDHHPIPNQRAAHEPNELYGPASVIDAPDHDGSHTRVSVLRINGSLSRQCRLCGEECEHAC